MPPAKSYELLVYGDGPSSPSPVLDGCHIMDGILLPKQFTDSESSLLELVSEGVEGLAQLHTANREIEYTGAGRGGAAASSLCFALHLFLPGMARVTVVLSSLFMHHSSWQSWDASWLTKTVSC